MKEVKTQYVEIELGGEINEIDIPIVSFNHRVNQKFGDRVLFSESFGDEYVSNRMVNVESNQLLFCLNIAYSSHIPIRLTPEILWMTIVHGISEYVRLYPDENRGILVSHSGKKEVEIREDSLINDKNKWQNIPQRLVNEIIANLDDKGIIASKLHQPFSETNTSDINTFRVGLLDVYSAYYEYTVTSMCNIPMIYLGGKMNDWVEFEKRVKYLSKKLDLSWWLDHILPIIDEIKKTIEGKINLNFWRSIYKLDKQSGGPFINGWVINFFPFLKGLSSIGRDMSKLYPGWKVVDSEIIKGSIMKKVYGRNPFLGRNETAKTLTNSSFHEGLSVVDFIWNKQGEKKKMELIGGFIGVCKDNATNSISPGLGWIVREK